MKHLHLYIYGLMLACALLCAGKAAAQTVVWQLPPGNHGKISRLAPNLYKVERQGTTGLIRADGTPVVSPSSINIGPYYEQKALITRTTAEGKQLVGYATTAGRYVPFGQTYFTLTGQEFYADGLLSVRNADGLPGYIGLQGEAVLGFEPGWYDKIKPFAEGRAAVFRQGKYSLIDKEGRPAAIIIGVGEVVNGTNVYQGKAYVLDRNGKFYIYNTATGKCEKAAAPAGKLEMDYLYRFAALTGQGKEPPFVSDAPTAATSSLPPTMEDGLYGYRNGSTTILPCQLTAASDFVDDLAVVRLNGQSGLLRYVETADSFALTTPVSHYDYRAGTSVECAFSLRVPQPWAGKALSISVTNAATGAVEQVAGEPQRCTFSVVPQAVAQHYRVAVKAEGLTLWQGSLHYTFKKVEEPLQVSLSLGSTRADSDNKVAVTATIYNPGAETVTATVNMTGSNMFKKHSESVTLAPGARANVQSYFIVNHKGTNQYVHVSTTKGGEDKKSGLTLETFY